MGEKDEGEQGRIRHKDEERQERNNKSGIRIVISGM
jgi:hypothetical protein